MNKKAKSAIILLLFGTMCLFSAPLVYFIVNKPKEFTDTEYHIDKDTAIKLPIKEISLLVFADGGSCLYVIQDREGVLHGISYPVIESSMKRDRAYYINRIEKQIKEMKNWKKVPTDIELDRKQCDSFIYTQGNNLKRKDITDSIWPNALDFMKSLTR